MTTTATLAVFVTDQMSLTRHLVTDFEVVDGTAWVTTRCGQYLANHPTVNVTRQVDGWWAGCPACGTPTTRPSPIDWNTFDDANTDW